MVSDAYKNAHHPGHSDAVADVAARFRALYPEPEAEPGARPGFISDVNDARKAVGVDVQVPTVYGEHWGTGRETEFLNYGIRECLPSATLQRVMDFVVDDYVAGGGQHTADAEARFAKDFAKELSPGQIRQLIDWYRSQA
jgi:hypothetical protein